MFKYKFNFCLIMNLTNNITKKQFPSEIKKIGNSLWVLIPSWVVKLLDLKEHTQVETTIKISKPNKEVDYNET